MIDVNNNNVRAFFNKLIIGYQIFLKHTKLSEKIPNLTDKSTQRLLFYFIGRLMTSQMRIFYVSAPVYEFLSLANIN